MVRAVSRDGDTVTLAGRGALMAARSWEVNRAWQTAGCHQVAS